LGMNISDFWLNRWVANPEWDFTYVLTNAWSLSGTKPLIDAEYNYRSIDVAHEESVLIKVISETEEFLGLGAIDYKRNFVLVITIRTSGDRNRKSALYAEVKRILRTHELWCGGAGTGYQNLLVVNTVDNVERMKKMSELILTVTCWRAEQITDVNL
jgi:hypothetical protein